MELVSNYLKGWFDKLTILPQKERTSWFPFVLSIVTRQRRDIRGRELPGLPCAPGDEIRQFLGSLSKDGVY